jgi:betaine-aldehyde dehydrogenase
VKDLGEHYIGGTWVPARSGPLLEVVNAATEEVIARVPAATAEEVGAAVGAARAAADSWAATAPAERARFLERIAQALAARAEELARTVTAEVGMPIKLSRRIQAGLPLEVAASFARLVREYPFEHEIEGSRIVHEPVGVVAAITPWNFPLHQAVAKVAPALAAGCTVVLKPSELAPLSAFVLAEAVHEAGLPRGVFNLVCGTGAEAGEALARHPEVDMVSFTGSTRAGRRVSEIAAQSVKRVALELGGKSPSIVLEDADLERAVKSTLASCYLNSGQTCSALTRLLVPRARYAQAAELAVAIAKTFRPGDPMDPETRLGPLVSAGQRERVRGYIRKGVAEGAKLLLGGPEPPVGLERGYFVQPTVFGEVHPQMAIAQEEIFGPVLSILAYRDEADAVDIANGTIYGLSAAVWSGERERALAIARRLKAGQVDVNGGRFNLLAPFGGYKQSGRGRELGRYGLEEFLEVKSLQLG